MSGIAASRAGYAPSARFPARNTLSRSGESSAPPARAPCGNIFRRRGALPPIRRPPRPRSRCETTSCRLGRRKRTACVLHPKIVSASCPVVPRPAALTVYNRWNFRGKWGSEHRFLAVQGTQRDDPDRDGMFVRMAKTRKTFMLRISQNGRHIYKTRGHYPELSMPRRAGRDARMSHTIEKRCRQADSLEQSACLLPETLLEAVDSAVTAPQESFDAVFLRTTKPQVAV